MNIDSRDRRESAGPRGDRVQLGRRQALQGLAALGTLGLGGLASAPHADAAERAVRPGLAAASYPVLRSGSSGSAVRDLQTRLAAQSYWLGGIDGSFGPMTLQAVYAVQKWWGLSRDGVVGPITWNRILRYQRPKSRYGGYRIEIDKSKQLAIAVWGGSVRYTFNTSTGANRPFLSHGHWYNGQTPSGHFTVFRHVNGWVYNDLGALYRPYFFNGGIAIHGDNPSVVPPYNASHGCCRVSTGAIDELIRTNLVANGRRISVF
ncbi:L,D-transpeptidase family protein [Leekyejoonella antrihumi]|uniref:Murein L,D-transpeptidase n=1 Tax=Leekyejoonella antrihumi TaxID=1660198 RepID=A0A563DU09_9MICO|nr:L,D-transpeptidase family protein [Leekyejoonella antrihumi]TWP33737.1 murein L,D-transpeptidase [Leekyejoonella antrihumi]